MCTHKINFHNFKCLLKCVYLCLFFLLVTSEHLNYFGVDENLGPVAVSIRRERLDDGKEKDGMQYNYRVTFRTSQVIVYTSFTLYLSTELI